MFYFHYHKNLTQYIYNCAFFAILIQFANMIFCGGEGTESIYYSFESGDFILQIFSICYASGARGSRTEYFVELMYFPCYSK